MTKTATLENEPCKGSGRTMAAWTAAILLLALLSYHFADIPLTVFCSRLDRTTRLIFRCIAQLGDSLWSLSVSLALYFFFRYKLKRKAWSDRALLVFASVAFSGLVVDLLKVLLARSRPDVLLQNGINGFHFFRIGFDFNSFPSGHSATAFSIAAALSCFLPRNRILLFLAASLVAFSRVALTAHFCSDILIGAFLGVLSVRLLERWIPVRPTPNIPTA